MKKIFLIPLFIFSLVVNGYSAPTNTISITPAASDGTTIAASDENTRNSEVSTKFNAHDHTDISQTANTLKVGDATAGNKTIQANNADASLPFIRYDDTNNRWVASKDGSNVDTLVIVTGGDNAFWIIPSTPTTGNMLVAGGQGLLFRSPVVGSFTRDSSTASGSQTVTGVGFVPSSIIFFATPAQAGEASWGFTSGTSSANNFILGDV